MKNLSSQLLGSETLASNLALEHLLEHILCELAGMAASPRSLDVLVFTGGVGENAAVLRQRVMAGAARLGLQADPAANQRGGTGCISAPGSRVAAWVLRTNEAVVIAQQTEQVLTLLQG